MINHLILFITWLAIVISGDTIKVPDNIAVSSDTTTKVKRYFNHDVSPPKSLLKSPCPPFYPHIPESKSPVHLTRPYGPPAYPKPTYGPPQTHHPQLIHQPTYMPYQSKPTISYTKPHIPIAKPVYHYIPSKSPQIIHPAQPIHHTIQKQAQWEYQPQQHYQKPQFSYAPLYNKPMIQPPILYMKQMNYHAHPMPGIVYKMDTPNCAPCHQQHQIEHLSQPIQQHQSMSQIIQPIHRSSPVYLPTSQAHVQPTIIKSIGHVAPCIK